MVDPAVAYREAAISVEAKLAGYAKRSDGGISLRFIVHPNDAPQQLLDAALGARYLMALVELGDNEEPKQPESRLTKQAGILCKDPVFWRFLRERFPHKGEPVIITNEKDAVEAVHTLCYVKSRREFIPRTLAGDNWEALYSRYIAWRDISYE